MGKGTVDGVLAHQRLAAAGGGAHHHRMPLVERIDRLELEGVEGEWENRGQIRKSTSYECNTSLACQAKREQKVRS
jgi:hypothetical protein